MIEIEIHPAFSPRIGLPTEKSFLTTGKKGYPVLLETQYPISESKSLQ
jgi:hypothetical protein